MAWYSGTITQQCSNQYYCDGSVEGGLEGGVDIATPYGTPVTSVTAGKVVGSGWYWGGWVVTVRSHVPFFNADADLYYQHLIDIQVKTGDTVSVGQVLGHTRTWIEFGINPGAWPGGGHGGEGWGGIWGTLPHPGRGINPVKSGFLDAIRTNTVQVQGADTSNIGGQPQGGGFLDFSWLTGSELWKWINNPMRIVKIVVGAALLLVSLLMIMPNNFIPSPVSGVASAVKNLPGV